MKSVFFALVAFVCGSVLAGEMPSVVNHNQAVPAVVAPAPVPATAPCVNCPASEVFVVASQPARPLVVVANGLRRCVNGRCSSSSQSVCTGPNCQKYAIKEDSTETVRKRWLGGVVIRNNARTVVKPVR